MWRKPHLEGIDNWPCYREKRGVSHLRVVLRQRTVIGTPRNESWLTAEILDMIPITPSPSRLVSSHAFDVEHCLGIG